MWYIGIDLHSANFDISVVGSDGKLLYGRTCSTTADDLIEAVGAVATPKRVVLEESAMAGWAYRLLSARGVDVVVAEPRHNRWIGSDENIDDQKAALRLANLLRGGFIKPVHHTQDPLRAAFKDCVLLYHQMTRQGTRARNQAKAKFRQHGVRCSSDSLFAPERREEWLRKLPDDETRFHGEVLLDNVDFFEGQKTLVRRRITQQARALPQVSRFQQVPGIGIIRAATFFAIIDTPERFHTKGRLWAYCGIGIVKSQSDQMQGPEHLNRNGNRLLKDMIKGAAQSAIRVDGSSFAKQYHAYVARRHKPELASLTVARSIACTLWAMWRKDQPYRDPTA
jgi:transposase